MSRWFRFYDEAINDPKVLKLPEAMRWHWVAALAIASKHNGILPHISDVALMLRKSEHATAGILTGLMMAGLLDRTEAGLAPHNWSGRQYKTDRSDRTNAERQQRWREKHRTNAVTPVTPVTTVTDKRPETDTDSEAEKERGLQRKDTKLVTLNGGRRDF